MQKTINFLDKIVFGEIVTRIVGIPTPVKASAFGVLGFVVDMLIDPEETGDATLEGNGISSKTGMPCKKQ